MSWDGKIYGKYKIEHADGTPLKGRNYFVLRLDSDDPVEAARVAAAMRAYKNEPRNCDLPQACTAKLREALIKAKSAICHFAKHLCDSLSWEDSNLQANCGNVLCPWRGLCRAKTTINAALFAPPRNCDALSKAEVLEELDKRSFSKEDTIEWLYAEKGEADGSK